VVGRHARRKAPGDGLEQSLLGTGKEEGLLSRRGHGNGLLVDHR
jgi:hypothetical protein